MRPFLLACGFLCIAVSALADAGPDAAALYKKNCALCHGADGTGKTPAGRSMKVRDLSSEEVQSQDAKALFAAIADGKGKMPAFKSKLDTAEIDAIVALIKSLKK